MADTCDFALAQDITASCENPQVQGLTNYAYLVNYNDIDWDSLTRTGNVITKLSLKTGKRGYEVYIPGKTPFSGTQAEMAESTYRNKFTKTASIVVLNSGPDVSANVIDQLANGQFVFIFENKYKGADGKNTFEVYGLEQGMSASAVTNEKYSEETDGGWAVTLVESNAPSSGIFYYQTDVATTRQALKTLVTPTSD